MKGKTYEWKEMTDTRELLEARTSPVITWFLVICVVLLGTGVGWSYFSFMDIVIKAQAVVRPNEKISTLTSNVQGNVAEINYRSGQHVKKGDILLRISLDNMDFRQSRLQSNYKKAQADLAVMKQIESDLKAGKLEDSNDGTHEASSSEVIALQSKWKLAFEQNNLEREQEELALQRNSRLLKSIGEGSNLFKSTELDYQRYENYRIKIEQLQTVQHQAKQAYKAMVIAGGDGKDEQEAITNAQRELESYRNQYMLDLNTAIEDGSSHIHQLQLERDNLQVQLQEAIETQDKQTKELGDELIDLNLQIAEHTFNAPISGVINVIQELAPGDLVQSGERILTIVPEEDSAYVVQLAISNQDIGSVEPGTTVKYNFTALPAKDYGYLRGTINWISPDATMDSQSGINYYLGQSSLSGLTLTDQNGKQVDVKVGMTAEAQMITKRERIWTWLMKKLDLR